MNDELIKATEVFTPNAYPQHTYVHRDSSAFELRLRQGLNTPGQLVSVSGPSKSGKTVLVSNVVGKDNLITVSGTGVKSGDELWDRVLDWIGEPTQTTTTDSSTQKMSATGNASGTTGIPLLARGTAGLAATIESNRQSGHSFVRQRRGLAQVVTELANSTFVILLDDFHYIDHDAQTDVARHLKDAAFQNVKIVTASVLHRSDDVVRTLPDLRGRVQVLDLPYWNDDDLRKIAELGFAKLNIKIDDHSVSEFVSEASGSPQLMQAICLNACRVHDVNHASSNERQEILTKENRERVFSETASLTSHKTLVDQLRMGARTRGVERTSFTLKGQKEADVYGVLLRALASDPPQQSFTYPDLTQRVRDVCEGELIPIGSALVSTCEQMDKIARESQADERVLDWDGDKRVLALSDPYLLFYLRWTERV